jgi:hypothetical protein
MELGHIKQMSHNDRLDALRDNADSVEQKDVDVPFEQEEIAEMKHNLSEFTIEKLKKEDELREISKGIRQDIKTQSENIKQISRFLVDGFRVVNQEVYNIADHENGMMLTYNGEADLISSRKLRPEERQARLININTKTA